MKGLDKKPLQTTRLPFEEDLKTAEKRKLDKEREEIEEKIKQEHEDDQPRYRPYK